MNCLSFFKHILNVLHYFITLYNFPTTRSSIISVENKNSPRNTFRGKKKKKDNN